MKKAIEPKPLEKSYEITEAFELASERARRIWVTGGGDVAHFVLRFLGGRRHRDISAEEIATTMTYARSSEAERAALTFVCMQAENVGQPTAEDTLQLHHRDAALIDFVEGRHVRGDLAAELRSIPAALRERADFDSRLFRNKKQYRAPNLFGWLLGAKNAEISEVTAVMTGMEQSHDEQAQPQS